MSQTISFTKRPRLVRHAQLLAVLAAFALMLGAALPAAASPKDLPTQALEQIAAQHGIPRDQLSITTEERSTFPLIGKQLIDYKVMARDGRTFEISFDRANGQAANHRVAAQQEQEARAKAYGKLDPSLAQRVKNNPAERVNVAVWVAMEDPGALARGNNANPQALVAKARAAQTPAADAARGLGAQVAHAEGVPVFFAELNAGQINALSKRGDVVAIQEVPQNLSRMSDDDGGTSDRFTYVWGTATGTGARVAVHEDDGVDNSNTYLVDPVYWCDGVNTGPGGTACTTGRNIGSHATNVAGVIASTNQWRRGGAWGISAGALYSANFQSFSSVNKINDSAFWATSNADVVNMSWGGCSNGSQNYYSRWADYLMRASGDPIIISSGNGLCNGTSSPPRSPAFVGFPSLGWNTISVGSYYDNNTGVRSDDVLSAFTSYMNPTDATSGRTYEKPDIAGMGGQLIESPFQCFGVETTGIGVNDFDDSTCGTSFAAPDAAALAALIIGKQPALRGAGEAVKAILMAGATHNIVDGANYRDCSGSPVASDCRDGAGAIDADKTISGIVAPGNWRFPGSISPSSFDANGNIDTVASLTAGSPARVTIAWDSTSNCTSLTSSCGTSDVLNADLDLHVLDPNGNLVCASASWQNSAEVCDFTPSVSGNYTIRVHSYRFDANTSTWLGLAWLPSTTDDKNPLSVVTDVALGTTLTNQTNNLGQSYWDVYSNAGGGTCYGTNQTGPEKIYRVTTAQPGQLTATLSNISGFPNLGADPDVIILRAGGSPDSQNTQMVGCGDFQAVASSQPAGTYYVVVDGYLVSVANYNLNISFTP